MLEAAGIKMTLHGGEPRKRAGLYSLTGAMDAIEHDLIKPGEQVLVGHTGGSGAATWKSFQHNISPLWKMSQTSSRRD